MQKIASPKLLDIVPHPRGLIYVEKELMDNGSVKASFGAFDMTTGSLGAVTTKTYLLCKFGAAFREISELLVRDHAGDFISCSAARLPNDTVIVLYGSGEMYIFDKNGDSVWSGDLLYQGESVRGLAIDGKNVWCVVPERNAVINYSPVEGRVHMRIGGGSNSAFSHPVNLSRAGNLLYICNQNSYKIRTVNLEDFSVADYMIFKEPVLNYFKHNGAEFAVLESGIYLL